MSEYAATGVALIAAERRRQIEAEGWTVEHDDSHDDGALAEAAAYLASASPGRRVSMGGATLFHEKVVQWPWDNDVTEHSRIDGLAKAGALIAAEIDRLQRAES